MNFLTVYNDIKEKGGATYNFFLGESPKSGYIVALKGHESIIDVPQTFEDFKFSVRSYLTQNRLLVLDQPNDDRYLGFWVNPEDNCLYIDIVQNYKSFNDALSYAIKNRQKAFYGVEANEVFWV